MLLPRDRNSKKNLGRDEGDDGGKNENAPLRPCDSESPCGDQNFLMFLQIEILMFSSFSTDASINIS